MIGRDSQTRPVVWFRSIGLSAEDIAALSMYLADGLTQGQIAERLDCRTDS